MISIVIPVYNEEEVLEHLYVELVNSIDELAQQFEIIFVDDGSTDDSNHKIKSLADRDSRVTGLKLSRNFGHQAAISAGMAQSEGDAVVVMDADLQDPPEVIEKLIERWKQGHEVVYAIRKQRKENWIKRGSYALFYRLLRITGDITIPLDSGDFCLMDRKVVDQLAKQMPENIRLLRGLRAYVGFRQSGVEYERAERKKGVSKYTPIKLIRLAFDGLFDYSTSLMRLVSYLGFLLALVFFILGIFFILHRVLDFKIFGYSPADVPGLATLAVGLFFLGGIILTTLGVMGEYISRIYFEVKNRPNFIVDTVYRKSESPIHPK